jgi:hypothetical protein
MTNLIGKQGSEAKLKNGHGMQVCAAQVGIWGIAGVVILLVSLFSSASIVAAQTKQTRQITIIQDMASAESLPAPQLEFAGKQDGEVSTQFKLKVTNRNRYPDFLWYPSANLPACGKNEKAARTWVEVFGSPGDQRLAGFCALSASEDLSRLWFPAPPRQKAPPCVFIVMTDRQTGKEYTSNRVCSRSFTVATDRLKAGGTQSNVRHPTWITVESISMGVHGDKQPSRERQAGIRDMQAEREKEDSQSGNRAVSGRITGVAVDPRSPNDPANKRDVAQPDLMIKQFLFPPTNDKALRVHIVNQGAAASGACRLVLTVRKINGAAVGRQTHVTITALEPGKAVWLVIDAKSILPNNVTLESTTFKLNADATGIVAESDETNNEVWHNL